MERKGKVGRRENTKGGEGEGKERGGKKKERKQGKERKREKNKRMWKKWKWERRTCGNTTLPVLIWRCVGWSSAGDAHWRSWCRTVQNCCSRNPQNQRCPGLLWTGSGGKTQTDHFLSMFYTFVGPVIRKKSSSITVNISKNVWFFIVFIFIVSFCVPFFTASMTQLLPGCQ